MSNGHSLQRCMVACAASLALAVPASAQALDWFLKIDGIKGESTDGKHKDEIVIESFSWGVERPSTTGGARAARPCFNEMAFVKFADSATPLLLANTFSGMNIPKAVLVGRKAGERAQEFLTIELSTVSVSSVSHSGSTESLSEAFGLRFARARVIYKPQNPDGTLGTAIETTLTGQTC